MTIYVHFKSTKTAEKLYNVGKVEDNGVDSVRVSLIFGEYPRIYTDVSHVAISPEKE